MKVRVPIEVDITCVNKTWFSLKKKIKVEPMYVIGIFQRQGRAIIEMIENNSQQAIEEAVLRNTEKGCILYAEENILSGSLREFYEISELKEGNRVDGDVHVNNVKNMWKDLKRVIKQTHIQVSKKHLQSYCNEVAWRINNRGLTATEKFNLLLRNSVCPDGRKSSYKNLIK